MTWKLIALILAVGIGQTFLGCAPSPSGPSLDAPYVPNYSEGCPQYMYDMNRPADVSCSATWTGVPEWIVCNTNYWFNGIVPNEENCTLNATSSTTAADYVNCFVAKTPGLSGQLTAADPNASLSTCQKCVRNQMSCAYWTHSTNNTSGPGCRAENCGMVEFINRFNANCATPVPLNVTPLNSADGGCAAPLHRE